MDLRFALRQIRSQPAFAATTIVTLALGIAATTAVYSIVDATLVRPLPFDEPERLVMVWEHNYGRSEDGAGAASTRNVASPANFAEWQARAKSFESLAAFGGGRGTVGVAYTATVAQPDGAERVGAGFATGNLFATLGVGAWVGRTLETGDSAPHAPDVVVLGHGYWQRRLGARPDVVGQSLVINGRARTVVGVLPASFDFPRGIDVWLPLEVDDGFRAAGGRYLAVVGRLRPAVGIDEARAEMRSIASTLEREAPRRDAGWTTTVTPMQRDLSSTSRPALLVLMTAVGALMLIAAVNVANLLLVRAVGRERELAVRVALGAGRWRLLRQALVESLVLGAAGCALGIVAAAWIIGAVSSMLPSDMILVSPVELNLRVLAFTLGAALCCTLLFGVAPALGVSRVVGNGAAPAPERGASLSPSSRRAFRGLVVAQVAVTLMLLVGGTLLGRSFWRLRQVDAGFAAAGVSTMSVAVSGEAYTENWRQSAFFIDLVDRISALPGVSRAGAISWRPFEMGTATTFSVLDRPTPPEGQAPVADVRFITPGLFATLGIPVKEGRDVAPSDTHDSPLVVVVNDTVARTFWPSGNALGQRVRMPWNRELVAEVVGVVGDVRLRSLDTPARFTLYWSVAQVQTASMTIAVQSTLPADTLLPALRSTVRHLDPDVPVANFASLERTVDDSLQQPRFTAILLATFAVLAFALASVALYGVVSYSVGQRRREFGVRIALGAERRDVVAMVLGEGLSLTLVAIGVGLAGALTLTRFARNLLFDVSPADPVSFGAATVVLAVVALAACLGPARRATRVDPVDALRAE